MAIFNLTCKVTVSAETEVEAETLEEAIEISKNRDVVIGGIGSGNELYDSWIIEDADGSPYEIVKS